MPTRGVVTLKIRWGIYFPNFFYKYKTKNKIIPIKIDKMPTKRGCKYLLHILICCHRKQKKGKMNAETILVKLIDLLLANLEELKSVADDAARQFQYGEKVALVECLEAIQTWDIINYFKLDFNVEERFPL